MWRNRLHTRGFRQDTELQSQIWCQRRSRASSELDTRAASNRVLSLAKWILHSADMWYLNFPLGWNVCRREKARWCLLISEQAVNGNLASQLRRVMALIRMKWWRGTPEGVTGRNTDCRYSQGHLHRSSQVIYPNSTWSLWSSPADGDRSLHWLETLRSIHGCQFVQTRLFFLPSWRETKRG